MSRRCADGAPAREDDGLDGRARRDPRRSALEPAFIALTLTPPSEADIAREIGTRRRSRRDLCRAPALRATIGARLGAALADSYRRMITPGPYQPDAKSAGRRALKNVCLDLLAATSGRAAIALALAQYRGADNMTDRMAALETLSLHDRPERAQALEDFYPATPTIR